jgi:hypothetical protein
LTSFPYQIRSWFVRKYLASDDGLNLMWKQFLSQFRNRALLLPGIIVILLLILVSRYSQEARLERATIKMINDAQTIWYPDPILNYHIVVDVQRPGEYRRNDLTVVGGEIVSATVMYRKQKWWGWEEPFALNFDQAYPFTIPGLYDMLRGAINANNRKEIRVDMQGYPPFPHRIEFGTVWQEGEPVYGTESRVIVKEFEVTP